MRPPGREYSVMSYVELRKVTGACPTAARSTQDRLDAGGERIFQERLLQHDAYACDGGPCMQAVRGVAGNQDGRDRDVPLTQVTDQLKAAHVRHVVVNDQ